jgi:hypothetical protein
MKRLTKQLTILFLLISPMFSIKFYGMAEENFFYDLEINEKEGHDNSLHVNIVGTDGEKDSYDLNYIYKIKVEEHYNRKTLYKFKILIYYLTDKGKVAQVQAYTYKDVVQGEAKYKNEHVDHNENILALKRLRIIYNSYWIPDYNSSPKSDISTWSAYRGVIQSVKVNGKGFPSKALIAWKSYLNRFELGYRNTKGFVFLEVNKIIFGKGSTVNMIIGENESIRLDLVEPEELVMLTKFVGSKWSYDSTAYTPPVMFEKLNYLGKVYDLNITGKEGEDGTVSAELVDSDGKKIFDHYKNTYLVEVEKYYNDGGFYSFRMGFHYWKEGVPESSEFNHQEEYKDVNTLRTSNWRKTLDNLGIMFTQKGWPGVSDGNVWYMFRGVILNDVNLNGVDFSNVAIFWEHSGNKFKLVYSVDGELMFMEFKEIEARNVGQGDYDVEIKLKNENDGVSCLKLNRSGQTHLSLLNELVGIKWKKTGDEFNWTGVPHVRRKLRKY